jgi:hypothetical protein
MLLGCTIAEAIRILLWCRGYRWVSLVVRGRWCVIGAISRTATVCRLLGLGHGCFQHGFVISASLDELLVQLCKVIC